MPNVEIEYCVPCGLLDTAQEVQTALLEEHGKALDTVTLRTGDGGVFKVRVDGEEVFDKAEDAFDLDAILENVDQRAELSAPA